MNMPVKEVVFFLLFFPAMLYASQEEDMELFEFLAVYDQNDNAFIDAEMDAGSKTAEADKDDSLTKQEVRKSKSDE